MARAIPCLLAGLFLVFGTFAAQAQTPPPAEAFLREVSNVQISPDGNYISMIQPRQGRPVLVVYPLGGGEPALIEGGARTVGEYVEVSSHFWSGDRIVVTVNWNDHYQSRWINVRLEQYRMLSVNPDGTDAQVLFESRQNFEEDVDQTSWVVDRLEDDDDHILVSTFDWVTRTGFRTVNRVNINTGRVVRVAQGSRDTSGWATDTNGNVIARVDQDDNVLRLMVRELGSLEWDTLFTDNWFDEDGQGTLYPAKVSAGHTHLYLYSNHEGRVGLYRTNLQEPSGLERIFLHDWVDIGGMDYSNEDDSLTSISYNVHTPRWQYFDEEEEAKARRYARLLMGGQGQFAEDELAIGHYVGVTSESDDENKRILFSVGPGDPPVYYLMDDEAQSITEVAQAYPNLSPDNLADISVVTYQARDGMEIPGYLALPPGRSVTDGPMPFVLWPHGGPNARDDASFDLLRQFLATRGYAVFAPQFRGSRGFGSEFLRAGFHEWGEAMQDDLTDATQHMINMGIADPDHMCIFGWSYSAYAALFAAIDTPDLYNCAIGINGVYDLPEMMGDLRTRRAWDSLRFWRGSMGDDWAALAQVSPNRRAEEIAIPVLVIASQEDPIVPYQETTRLVSSLRRADRDFEYQIYERGNHSMDYVPNLEDTLLRVERFLDEHM